MSTKTETKTGDMYVFFLRFVHTLVPYMHQGVLPVILRLDEVLVVLLRPPQRALRRVEVIQRSEPHVAVPVRVILQQHKRGGTLQPAES